MSADKLVSRHVAWFQLHSEYGISDAELSMKELAFFITGLVLGNLLAGSAAKREHLERELERERGRNAR